MTAKAVTLASEQICARLTEWPIFQQAQTVMAYIAFGNELPPAVDEPIQRQAWVIPRTEARPEPRLILHPYTRRGWCGIALGC